MSYISHPANILESDWKGQGYYVRKDRHAIKWNYLGDSSIEAVRTLMDSKDPEFLLPRMVLTEMTIEDVDCYINDLDYAGYPQTFGTKCILKEILLDSAVSILDALYQFEENTINDCDVGGYPLIGYWFDKHTHSMGVRF